MLFPSCEPMVGLSYRSDCRLGALPQLAENEKPAWHSFARRVVLLSL
jgi:hypothetical protein